MDMRCDNCGNEFTAKISKQRFCSSLCKKRFYGKNATIKEIYLCKHCGKQFTPKAKDRTTYCSRECAFTNKKAKPEVRQKIVCAICGKEFKSRLNAKYCSNDCRIKHDAKISKERYLKYKKSDQYQVDLAKRRETYKPDNIYKKICKQCGKKYETSYGRSVGCSLECSSKYQKKLHRGNVSKAKKQRVLERDNYTCRLCGKKLRMDKMNTLGTTKPHLLAPTVDHIIPGSVAKEMGWSKVKINNETNLQAAHFICNVIKSNKLINQQYINIWEGRV
jgi:hypothetical protein